MTTEPRPVVPGMEGLRVEDAIRRGMASCGYHANDASIFAVRQEIAAAGLSIVASDRLERLTSALSQIDTALTLGGAQGISKWGIQPGDLDPLAGGDR